MYAGITGPGLRVVFVVDAAAASKDLESAKAQKGFKECKSLEAPPSSQAMADQGQALYLQNCASCHGDLGKGDGPAVAALDPKPRDLTKPADYKFGHLDLSIFRTAKYGIEGSGMAPKGSSHPVS